MHSSKLVRFTAERDGLLDTFEEIGGVFLANACGPCIGQWARHMDDPNRKNSIITSFNRNFAKQNDGNSSTHVFVASPKIVTALSIAGDLTFNPMTDTLTNESCSWRYDQQRKQAATLPFCQSCLESQTTVSGFGTHYPRYVHPVLFPAMAM